MKILTRYIISSILKVAIIAILMFALILAAVELFSRMDAIMNGSIPALSIIYYLLLSIPQYLLMVASISFLFAVTYFLSSLTANNELIPILNAGVSPARLKFPIIVLAGVLTVLGSVFQEEAVIRINSRRDVVEAELFGSSSTRDYRNLVLEDSDGYMIYTQRFQESTETVFSPVLLKYDGSGSILMRIDASSAYWDDGQWIFTDASVYEIKDGSWVETSQHAEYAEPLFDVDPSLFRSQNISIDTMDRETARAYLEGLETTNRNTWQERATEYYRRICSPLAIFVLMFISSAMNYRFKKNVLLFSVIQSLSIAVIYYVADMVFSIMGNQGVVTPIGAVIWPIAMTLLLSLVLSLLGRKI